MTEIIENIESDIQVREPKKDNFGRSYATGKRKDSVAKVWVKSGKGQIIINKIDITKYFGRATLRMLVKKPFEATKTQDAFDVICSVEGGGLSGQAGAIKHGISKAIALFNPDLRPVLRTGGYLTRDSRVVERKKCGFKKARRGSQFSKR
ncbi:MAG: 30S ribosomal protein S9 [Alphaproteobacteria bacterium]|nr:30S ribosomal protein S9 [Alphaproteobacteria bacterium]